MKKESIIQISIGAALLLIAALLELVALKGGRVDPWLPVIFGAIAVPIIFPPVIRWAHETKQTHQALSIGVIVFLAIWALLWITYIILTILGVAK
ncbi:hypothetical protein SDC9_158964 [bioreactor metagenome]|uniref:Inner membrane protein YhaI n=1 Tax=bioreactor metagenome TaxID=1076179 RepID=A0A645FCL5_9ZZZZ|nr:hypothetical protein [Christensenella sp.]